MPDEEALDDESVFGANLLENLFATWIDPELRRRGMTSDRSAIWAAVVELSPLGGSTVTINEEASVAAKAQPDSGIATGTALTPENAENVEWFVPTALHPDSGWLVYVVAEGLPYLAFDLRYNKGRVRELLALAEDYLATARSTYLEAPRPAIDNLFSAAELTIQAQMLTGTETTKLHRARDKWLKQEVELANIPPDHHKILNGLHTQRAAARYADGPVGMTAGDVAEAIDSVAKMIEFARVRSGVPVPVQP